MINMRERCVIMLIQFSFKNFRSFMNEATLDMSAAKITEFSNTIIPIGGDKILPVAAIYGANASGKSNVYSAFQCMSMFVVNSFKFGDETEKFERSRPDQFAFSSETMNLDTSFEVYFTIPGDPSEKTYNYGFCVNKSGITEEWYNIKSKTARTFSSVFYRDKDTMDLSGLPKESRKNIEVALENQVLIASLGAKLRVEKCKTIRDWFFQNELADFGNPITSLFKLRMLPSGFVDNPEVRNNVVQYLSSFDDSIKGFRVEKIPAEEKSDSEEQYIIKALHKTVDSNEYTEIPLEKESAGTLKMFALYPDLMEVMNKGAVYFVDELNARLHPLLVRNIILTFLNPEINKKHAQLVFTTHDTWHLSNQLLRRDEIWFVEKDNNGISSLYSLADFVNDDGNHIRKDESYERNYLLGKYGAIPSLNYINIFKEE